MSCKVERKDGKIVNVETPQNEKSLLFEAISKIPHIKSLDQALEVYKNIYSKKIKSLFPEWKTTEEVKIEKTDSSNPSFEKGSMLTLTVEGGVLEIGKVKGAKVSSILQLKVDENARRQGKATQLLTQALKETLGELSGQASNNGAVELNYKLGMRASIGGKELSLKESKEARESSAGESVRMLLPENKRGENFDFKDFFSTLPSEGDVRDAKYSVFITPATIRSFSEETSRLKELTEEYSTVAAEIAKGDLTQESRFSELQGLILDTYQSELQAKVKEIEGVDIEFNSPYLGSWQGEYEPSLNLTIKVTEGANTVEASNLFFDLAESTSQDSFIVEKDSNLGRPALTEEDSEGNLHYPQLKYKFKGEMSVVDKSEIAQALNKEGINDFSIDGDYFLISVMDFDSTSNAQKIENYEKKRDTIDGVFGRGFETDRGNRFEKREVIYRQSKLISGRNEGNEQQERRYNRSDVFEEQRGDGNRGGRDQSRSNQTLEGAPTIKGATGADSKIVAVIEKYAAKHGIEFNRQSEYSGVDEHRATRIAEAYTEMEHNPQDPKVKEAFQNLIVQLKDQFDMLVEEGYEFYFYNETNDPYDGNPWNAMRELRKDKRMGVFATDAGFGSGATELNVDDNPLLADTGIEWGFGSTDGKKVKVLANDLFRAVHDVFGHGVEGAGFRAKGEENAWQAHARLFTGSAVAAMTSETRGQNSWLNYGEFGEQNRTAKVEDTIFADQKTGLMPEWTWNEGYDEGLPNEVLKANEIAEVDSPKREATWNTMATGEPKMFFKNSNGKVSESYSEVLKDNTTTNGKIEAGFISGENVSEVTNAEEFTVDNSGVVVFGKDIKINDSENFISVAELDGSTDESTVDGMLNSHIKRGIISGELFVDESGRYVVGEGTNTSTQEYNIQVALPFIVSHANTTNVKVKDGALVSFERVSHKIEDSEGNEISNEEFDLNQEKYANDPNLGSMLSQRLANNGFYSLSKDVLQGEELTESEEQLTDALVDFINSLGIKIGTIEEYRKKYKTKFGTEPSIKGLADMANNIIAFKDGVMTKETFVEEVSHFMVEAFDDQSVMVDAMLSVVGTAEYAEAKAKYTSIYSKLYDGVQLEEALRKEALGSILSKALLNNFTSTDPKTQGVFEALRKLFTDFIDSVKNYFRPEMNSAINELTSKVTTHLLNRDFEIFNSDNLKESDYVLYDIANVARDKQAIVHRLSKARQALEKTFNISEGSIEAVNDEAELHTIWGAVASTIGIAENEVNYLKDNVAAVIEKGQRPTVEMTVAFASLDTVVMPVINELNAMINRESQPEVLTKEEFRNIKESLAEVTKDFGIVKGDWNNIFSSETFKETVLKEVAKQMNWSDKFTAAYMKSLDAETKDVSVIMKTIGMVAHRANPILSLLQQQVNRINSISNKNFLDDTKTILNTLFTKGLDKHAQDLQIKDEKGNATEWLMSPVDFKREEEERKMFMLKTRISISGKIDKSASEITNEEATAIEKQMGTDEEKFTFDKRQVAKYEVLKNEWNRESLEQRFVDSYYAEQEEWIKESPELSLGLTTTKNFNRDVAKIKAKYSDANGIFDMSLLEQNKPDYNRYKQVIQSKKRAKVPFDSEGKLKKGLEYNAEGRISPSVLLNNGTNLSDSELITWGMYKVSEKYLEREKDNGKKFGDDISDVFASRILELEKQSNAEAYNFVRANGGINLNADYWDTLSGDESYVEKMDNIILTLPEDEKLVAQERLLEYVELNNQKKALNSVNKDISQPLELNYSNNSHDKKNILDIDERLSEIKKALPTIESEERAVESEIHLNEAYKRDILNEDIEEGSEEELDFLLENSTKSALRRITLFEDRVKKNALTAFDERHVKDIDTSLSKVEYVLQAKLSFAKSNVGSYYKRFTPQGYNQFLTDLNNGSVSPSVLLNKEAHTSEYNGVLKYLTLSPNFDWQVNAENSDIINPNYESEGMSRQLKKSKWLNEEFFTEFGINKKDFLNGTTFEDLVPTKNVEKFEALKLMTDLRQKSLDRKGDGKYVSKFRLPRVGRGNMELFRDLFKGNKGGSAGEIVNQLTNFRVDELEIGEQVGEVPLSDFSDLRSVPKFYERPLEKATDQSDNVLGILALDNQQANLYDQRTELESSMLLTMNQMYSMNMKGKNAKESRAADMGREYINANLYGVQHNYDYKVNILGKTVNFAKVLSGLNSYIRHNNLAYNFIVDATGVTTSYLARKVVSNTEEFFTKESYKAAAKQSAKMLPKLLGESGNVHKTSELQNLLEFFGDIDLTERTGTANFSKGVRLLAKSGYGASKVSNLTNSPILLLSLLNDTRWIGGNFINYREFSELEFTKDNTISEADLKTKWKTFEEKSLHNVLDYSNPKVDFKADFKNSIENDVEVLENINSKISGIFTHLKGVTDGVIDMKDQVYAQRNPLLNFLMTHKGWFVLNLERKFKKRQLSQITNQEEIGQYTAVLELLTKIISEYRKDSTGKSIYKIVTEELENLSPYEKKLMKANRIDTGITMALSVMGIAMLGLTEDDDTKDLWAVQLAGLLYYRTVSEKNSTNLFGIKSAIVDNIKEPIVGGRFIDELTKLDGYSMDTIKSGKFKGHTKFMRKIAKMTLGKRYFDLVHVRETSQSYRFYNASSLNGLGKGGLVESLISD